MRHPYTPVFRDLLTSSLWATATPATRCVWVTMLLMADPEGYVPAAVPGLALAANVSVGEARAALRLLESPDPDSRTVGHEGRRIEKVDHGWRIINFVAWRERAIAEAEKARKRAWAKHHRSQPANDNGDVADVAVRSEYVDAPKPKPKSKPSAPQKEQLPPNPQGGPPQVLPVVLRELPEGYELSDELRAEAIAMGVPPALIDERVKGLSTGPIGGSRGVLSHKLDDYFRRLFPKWRTEAETDRAKAQRAAQAPPGRAFGGAPRQTPQLEPNAKHEAFARHHGIDLQAIVRKLNFDNVTDALGAVGARKQLERALEVAARERAIERARATG